VHFDTLPTYKAWVAGAPRDDTTGALTTPAAPLADEGHSLSAAHQDLQAPRLFVPAGVDPALTVFTASAPLYATAHFPFTSPYGFHGGRCAGENPSTFDATYFDTVPGRVRVDPGQTYDVTVREPAANLTILDRQGQRAPNNDSTQSRTVNVVFTLADPGGCKERLVFRGQYGSATSQIYQRGQTFPDGRGGVIDVGGTLKLPGLPFGRWNVCVDDGNARYRHAVQIDTTVPGGATPRKIDLNATGDRVTGTCATGAP
jgi:hypothetical protein